MKQVFFKIQATIKDESKQKLLIIPALLLLFVVSWFAAESVGLFQKENTKKIETTKPVIAVKEVPQEKIEQNSAPTHVTLANTIDIAQIYPFITEDSKIAGQKVAMNLPVNSGNGSLPAIPNYQPSPNVGNIPLPAIPPIPGGSADMNSPRLTSSRTQSAVTGVLTGQGENGKNIAIMSDGRVVQEGDSYGDNKISAITGDGIHFENGNSISYGIK